MSMPPPRALLITDARGQIIDRIGRSWAQLGRGFQFEIIRSAETSAAECCRRAGEAGFVFWLDFRRFCQIGRAVTVPQAVLVHHVIPEEKNAALKALADADALAASSKRWQARLKEWTGRDAAWIPYALDTRHFSMRGEGSLTKGDPFVLGFIGKGRANLNDRKGTALLVEAMKELARQGHNIELLLTGPDWDDLENTIRSTGVPVRRMQFETTEETVAAYAAMDVLLVTALEEGGAVSILEAMALGVPVITTDVGHVPEVVRNGETGLVCHQRSPTAFATRVASLMADAALRGQITLKARAFVESARDERRVVPAMDVETIYRNALGCFSRRSPQELRRRHRRASWLAFRQKISTVLQGHATKPS